MNKIAKIRKSIFKHSLCLLSKLKSEGLFPENTDVKKIAYELAHNFEKEKTEFRRSFYRLGREYYNQYIPFYAVICAIDEIEKYVIGDIGDLSKEDIDNLCDYFERTKDQISYGYLISMVNSDKNFIRKELKLVKDKNLELKEFLRRYLIWVNKVIEDIKKLRNSSINEKYVPILNEKNNKFLETLSKSDIEAVKDVHNRLINTSFIIHYAIEKRRFTILVSAYTEFLKLISKLISITSVNIAVKYSEEVNLDHLTNTLNRRALDFILNSQFQIAKISKKPLSIAIIDIDDFKKVNDTYGHLVGDCVLRKFAYELKKSVRKVDLIFRYGGEEFLILFPFTDLNTACQIVKNALNRIRKITFYCHGKRIKITFSAGVETLKNYMESSVELIHLADMKMYKAKTTGKNKVIC